MNRNHAVLAVLAGAICMSFAGLCVRLLNDADGYQILTYRGIAQCLMVWTVACITRNIRPQQFIRAFDRTDGLIGVLMAGAFCFYVFSLLNTSVASTLFILSIAPVFAALLGWLFNNEKPTMVNSIAIICALIGVLVMVGAGVDLNRTAGNLFAVISALAFACMLVIARHSNKKDVLAGNFLGALLASITMAILAVTIGRGLQLSAHDLSIALIMGAFSIGLGISLVAWAAPNLPAAEVSLLVLLESVVAPLWVWLFLGEAMSGKEIIGGGLILSSVVMLSLTRLSARKLARR